MNEASRFEMYKKKLDNVCEENNLVYRFRRDSYPITLTIRPAGDIAEQLDMLANADEGGYTSPDAAIVFSYRDGELTYKTIHTFSIDDALLSRIKNLFKKLHFCWLQYFHRDLMEKQLLSASAMPVIDEDDAYDGEADVLETADEDDDAEDEDDESTAASGQMELNDMSDDVAEAVRIVRAENKASVALLQRRMNIGYAEATQLIDELEACGVIGPFAGASPREVLPWDEPDDAAALDIEE